MARQIRKKSGTGIYHIMLRGIPLMIQSLEKVRRNEILITAKAMGAGLRQQSRLTCVSDDTHTPTYNEIKNIENGKAIRVQK
jgi:hypothetical protein